MSGVKRMAWTLNVFLEDLARKRFKKNSVRDRNPTAWPLFVGIAHS